MSDPANKAVGQAVEPPDDVTKGKPGRKRDNQIKLGIAAIGVLALSYFMFVHEGKQAQRDVARGEVNPVEATGMVDAAKEAAKGQAGKGPKPSVGGMKVEVSPTGPRMTEEPTKPADDNLGKPGYKPGSEASGAGNPGDPRKLKTPAEIAAEKAEEARALKEKIAAGAMEVTGVRIASDSGSSSTVLGKFGMPAGPSNPKLAELDRHFQDSIAQAEQAAQRQAQSSEADRSKIMQAIAGQGAAGGAQRPGSASDFVAQNSLASAMGDRNIAFQKAVAQEDVGVSPVVPKAPASKSMIFEGTVIDAGLVTALSSQLPGKVLAQVESDVYDSLKGECLLIPRFSKLIGTYNSQVNIGQEVMFVAFTRLILPDGRSVALAGASATDTEGRSGMPADINNHFWKQFGSAFAISAISLALPKSAQTVSVNVGAAGQQTVGSTVALTFNEVVRSMLERNRQIAPSASREKAFRFNILVQRDISMGAQCQ